MTTPSPVPEQSEREALAAFLEAAGRNGVPRTEGDDWFHALADAITSTFYVTSRREPIEALIERSSFGTLEAKAARESVSPEQADDVVRRSREIEAARHPRPATVSEGVTRALRTEEKRLAEIVESASPFMSGWHEETIAYAALDLRDIRAHLEALPHLTAQSSPVDPWCREESCRYRHWRSGDMPTHRRGEDCPDPAQSPPRPERDYRHEFDEDANDGSMCVCGVPALTHESVEPRPEAEEYGRSQRHEADALLNAVTTIKATGGAVEIAGVRIEACDTFGQTETTLDRDRLAKDLYDAGTEVEQLRHQIDPTPTPPRPERDVKAEALREAAAECGEPGAPFFAPFAAQWLEHRAAALDGEAGS